MKKFKFDSGQVKAEIIKESFTDKKIFMITFMGRGLCGWGISKQVNKAEYDNFNVDQARMFAEKAEPMLSVG